jgi:hypothetical protein
MWEHVIMKLAKYEQKLRYTSSHQDSASSCSVFPFGITLLLLISYSIAFDSRHVD